MVKFKLNIELWRVESLEPQLEQFALGARMSSFIGCSCDKNIKK